MKNNDENLKWEEISTEHIVQNEWIDFRKSAYRFPDGSVFEPFYSYSRRDYVVIVASDTEGNFICVRQFRQGIKEVTTEFPAGGIERSDGKEYGPEGSSEKAQAARYHHLLRLRRFMTPNATAAAISTASTAASMYTCEGMPPLIFSSSQSELSSSRVSGSRLR